MKQLNTSTFLRLFVFAAFITIVAIWLSSKLRNQTVEADFDTSPYEAELKEMEKQLLKEYKTEQEQSLTVFVYDMNGNLLTTKTYTDELILQHDFILPDKYEYLATIHNDVYVIRNL